MLIDLDSRGLPARLPAVFLHQAPEGECGEARPRLVLYRGEEFLADTDISILTSASKSSIRKFVVTEKATTRAFSWLKAATTAFTFKTLLRHYAKQALTPRSLNVKLGPRHKYHEGRAAKRHLC